jgi:organic radical activating enzyme
MTPLIDGLHIELTNICTLKCPGCARTQFIDQFGKHWKNHSVDPDELDQFLDVDLTDKIIVLCGNYGDPIYHPEFFDLIQMFKRKKSTIRLITNGSYKDQQWWEKLCSCLDSTDNIAFSVDGTPDNFAKYRINADWDSIETGMKVVGESHVHSEWKYIPFNFNIDTIDQARDLSTSMGIKNFKIIPSDRFDQYTEHLKPTSSYVGNLYSSQIKFKNNQTHDVTPECSNGKKHYISADGFYSPCCYAAEHRFYYKTIFGKEKKLFDIRNLTLSQILSADQTVAFYSTITDVKPTVCQFNCPSIGQ